MWSLCTTMTSLNCLSSIVCFLVSFPLIRFSVTHLQPLQYKKCECWAHIQRLYCAIKTLCNLFIRTHTIVRRLKYIYRQSIIMHIVHSVAVISFAANRCWYFDVCRLSSQRAFFSGCCCLFWPITLNAYRRLLQIIFHVVYVSFIICFVEVNKIVKWSGLLVWKTNVEIVTNECRRKSDTWKYGFTLRCKWNYFSFISLLSSICGHHSIDSLGRLISVCAHNTTNVVSVNGYNGVCVLEYGVLRCTFVMQSGCESFRKQAFWGASNYTNNTKKNRLCTGEYFVWCPFGAMLTFGIQAVNDDINENIYPHCTPDKR